MFQFSDSKSIGQGKFRKDGREGMFSNRKTSHEFTLIELLVVVSIIAILAGILLPVLNKARNKGKETVELNAVKQLMLGYQYYSDESAGYLLPGYTSWTTPLVDDRGHSMVMPIVSMRWPWRLYPQLKSLHGTILTGAMSEFMKSYPLTDTFYNYYISVFPSFAYNYYNIGGQYPDPKNNAMNDPDVAVKTNEIKQPSRLITFVSAFSGTQPYGYMYCIDPIKGGWETLPFDPNNAYGYVHARWSKRAVTGEADGHAEMVAFDTLRKETNRWKNRKN
ncbi:MAG: hypothetical protein BWY31_00744 [Lentisphaerae bacterium ADurb.Bin242]|nr:MAG: hypothetical protein BWY31_00744 [Lentisphaerae bacterium ADurb.Bin242]